MALPTLPSLRFYPQAAWLIWRAARKAAGGRLCYGDLVIGSHAMRRALERVGVRFDIQGQHRLAHLMGPVVFVANHMSALETQTLPAILQDAGPCTFVIKDSLLRLPMFGPVLRGFDPIVVSRADARQDLMTVLHEGRARLARGQSVIIFPQGHRSPEFDPQRFNSLGMRLARQAQVPLVPIALDTAAWEIGTLVSDIGRIVPTRPVRFAIGAPISPHLGGKAMQRESLAHIEQTLSTWKLAHS